MARRQVAPRGAKGLAEREEGTGFPAPGSSTVWNLSRGQREAIKKASSQRGRRLGLTKTLLHSRVRGSAAGWAGARADLGRGGGRRERRVRTLWRNSTATPLGPGPGEALWPLRARASGWMEVPGERGDGTSREAGTGDKRAGL